MSDLDPNRPLDPAGGTTNAGPTPTAPMTPPAPASGQPDLDATTVTPVTPVATTPLTPGATTGASTADVPASYPVEQPLEPGVAWAPAMPVKTSSSSGSGRGRRLRWAAALAVVALVLGASAAVAALITNAASQATVLGYVPTDSVAYVEARLDLPGDQRRSVGEFLSHFPGFADQAALDSKLDQALDQVIHDATNNQQSYTTDIKPWFGGEIAFSVGPLPSISNLGGKDPSTVAREFRALGLLSVTDPVKAQAYLDKLSAKTGEETTKQTYNGAQLTVYQAKDGPALAYAVIGGKVAALGDLASVKAAVDSNGNSGFASQPGPKAALDAADKDHVGFVYVALRPLLDWSTGLSKAVSGATGASGTAIPEPVSDTLLKTLPEWGSYWLRFENDALVLESAAPKPEISFASTDSRASTIVKHVPSSALVMAETNGLGATLGKVLDLYKGEAQFKPLIDQLDQALGLVGGRDAALGWIGDTAIVLNDTGDTPEGGLLIAPTDPEKAKSLLTSLGTLVGLGGAQSGITLKTEDHNGTTITIVDIADIGKLTGSAGGGVGAMPLPFNHVELAYAVTNDVVVLGSSPDFVKHVLDTTDSTSLANDPQYKDLAGRVGAGTGQTFVDITAVRTLLEKVAPSGAAADRQKYETDIKPFLEPFDAMMASGTFKDDLGRSTVIITVK